MESLGKDRVNKGRIKTSVLALLNLRCLLDIQVDGSRTQLDIRMWRSGCDRDKIFGVIIVDRCDQMKLSG